MGRWAQRTRSGGGAPNLASIITATDTAPDIVRLTYTKDVTASAFTPDDFESLAGSTLGDSFVQISRRTVDLQFVADINTDTSLVYTGTTAGILTPQTVAH